MWGALRSRMQADIWRVIDDVVCAEFSLAFITCG